MSENWKIWLRSLVISLVIFLIFSLYSYLRRGNYDLNAINGAFASTAVMLAGITLLIGPLRKISFVVPFMTIRRHLGLLAFGYALLHITVSLLQILGFDSDEWIAGGFGALAILIWGYMAYISRNSKVIQMGLDIWKKRLSLAGKIAFIAIFLHLVIFKYQGWIKWFSGDTKQSYPPGSLVIFIIMLAVIVFRLVYDFYKHIGKTK